MLENAPKNVIANMKNKRRAFVANPSIAEGWELLMTIGPVLAVIALAFFLAMRFMPPPPPKVVNMTTGGQTGGYYAFGQRYSEILARSGVRLVVQTSAGSIENLKLLTTPSAGVSVGLLQGGIGNNQKAPNLISLGRIFHEPLWIFYRGAPMEKLGEFAGKRLAVGPVGSGTRALLDELLTTGKITEQNATLSPLTGQAAVDALKKGDIDVVFLALAPQAPLIQSLIRDKDIRLMSLAQADALTRIHPYLARLTLPQGVFDIAANIPDRDVVMVAPQAALVVDNETHPAIIALLAEAVQEVHGKPSILAKAGEFPSQVDPEFEMAPEAVRYYKSGPTFWKRILPYWIANLVERSIVFLVPLLTVLIPLAKVLPAVYKWRFRRRLLHWYTELKDVEAEVAAVDRGDSGDDLHQRLDTIDGAVSQLPVPVQFAEQFYNLREHLDLVRERLKAKTA